MIFLLYIWYRCYIYNVFIYIYRVSQKEVLECNFFACLDELDHLEAKKRINENDRRGHLDQTLPHPRMMEIQFFFFTLPNDNWS